ncbi:MAG: squalene synthase HpnC [Sphingomonadales bacterium]
MTPASPSLETPSGKGAADENFPVGSRLIAARLRPHVLTFYAYARAIDDIADNPALSPAQKIERLDRFADAVTHGSGDPGLATAQRMHASLLQTRITPRHCTDLVSAFKQDAIKTRYADWPELIDYCNRSAAPVGRYLLDLHGEDPALYGHADALCNALQVINHLQDCKDDLAALDRCYLPGDWLAEAGARVEDLGAAAASPALRQVIRRCVGATQVLLDDAAWLAPRLNSRRLGLESAVIYNIARRLCGRLHRDDPVAQRVALGKPAAGVSALAAIFAYPWTRIRARRA